MSKTHTSQEIYNQVKQQTKPHIFARGYKVVSNILEVDSFVNGVVARIEGSDDIYNTEIGVGSKNQLETSCTCPYFRQYGENCKHISALARFIKEKEISIPPSTTEKKSNNTDVSFTGLDKLEKLDLNTIADPNLKTFLSELIKSRKTNTTKVAESESFMQKTSKLEDLSKIFNKKKISNTPATNKPSGYMMFVLDFKQDRDYPLPQAGFYFHNSRPTDIYNIHKANYRDFQNLRSSKAKYLTELDKRTFDIMDRFGTRYYHYYSYGDLYTLQDIGLTKVLKLLKDEDKLCLANGKKIQVAGLKHKAIFKLETKLDKQRNLIVRPIIKISNSDKVYPIYNLKENEYKIFGQSIFWFIDLKSGNLYSLETELEAEQITSLKQSFTLAPDEIPQFVAAQEEIFGDVVELDSSLQIKEEMGDFKPALYLKEDKDSLQVTLAGDYHSDLNEVNLLDDFPEKLTATDQNNFPYKILRNKEKEQELIQKFEKVLKTKEIQFFVNSDDEYQFEYQSAAEFLTEVVDKLETLEELKDEQIEVFGKEKLGNLNFSGADIKFNLSSGIDWLELEGGVTFQDQFYNFAQIAKMLNKGRFIKLKDGKTGVLPKEWYEKNQEFLEMAEKDGSNLRVSKFHLALAKDFIASSSPEKEQKKWENSLDNLLNFKAIEKRKVKNLKAKLRPYQQAGYEWLHFLHDNKIGGILADDMGLGKTLQTLALLNDLYVNSKTDKPSLIVLPTSLIFNWQAEIKKFAPKLKFYDYTGADREIKDFLKKQKTKNPYHLLITSYGTLLRDIEKIKQQDWYYVILDESQQIKNPGSLTFKAVKTLKAEYRLALTGTPVENNLQDLWAQFSFINPGMLGSHKYFKENFANPIHKNNDKKKSEKLQKLAYPFILRRLKQDVAKELEDKVENTIYVEMDKNQEKLYNQTKAFFKKSILQEIETKGLSKSKFKVLEGLLRLRQICCHPALIQGSKAKKSAKMETMLEYLEEAVKEGHKILIFSQFAQMLKIIQKEVIKRRIKHLYLDGQTKNRGDLVNKFQNDENYKVFLISLKAGGTGLNLTAADYVFMFDPWWNPAAENQAIDRTHRIGQKKSVFSYKFIVKNSVEEKILKLQEKKQNLVKHVISIVDRLAKTLDEKSIKELFG